MFNKCVSLGMTMEGASGFLGNVQAESALKSNNLQDVFNSSLGMTDEHYVNAVNVGAYTRQQFIFDQAGFGLCQWTYHTRKAQLYDYAKSRGKSIDDEEMQIEFAVSELKSLYPSVWRYLTKNSIENASKYVLLNYECPANASAQIDYRLRLSKQIFAECSCNASTSAPAESEKKCDTEDTVYWPMRTLCRGMIGADVRVLNTLLYLQGLGSGEKFYRGVFDEDTERNVKEFQRQNNLSADGIVGKYTKKALGL